ncbi:MAG: hypothetical protein ABI780_04585 [Ardenticatenales bacterium]
MPAQRLSILSASHLEYAVPIDPGGIDLPRSARPRPGGIPVLVTLLAATIIGGTYVLRTLGGNPRHSSYVRLPILDDAGKPMADAESAALTHVVLQLDRNPGGGAWAGAAAPWDHVPAFTLFDDGRVVYQHNRNSSGGWIRQAKLTSYKSAALVAAFDATDKSSLELLPEGAPCPAAAGCPDAYAVVRYRRDGRLLTAIVPEEQLDMGNSWPAVELLENWTAADPQPLDVRHAVVIDPPPYGGWSMGDAGSQQEGRWPIARLAPPPAVYEARALMDVADERDFLAGAMPWPLRPNEQDQFADAGVVPTLADALYAPLVRHFVRDEPLSGSNVAPLAERNFDAMIVPWIYPEGDLDLVTAVERVETARSVAASANTRPVSSAPEVSPEEMRLSALMHDVESRVLSGVRLQVEQPAYEPQTNWPDDSAPWGHVPFFTLFDDGWVVRSWPGNMTGGGVYRYHITPAEADGLVQQILGAGVGRLPLFEHSALALSSIERSPPWLVVRYRDGDALVTASSAAPDDGWLEPFEDDEQAQQRARATEQARGALDNTASSVNEVVLTWGFTRTLEAVIPTHVVAHRRPAADVRPRIDVSQGHNPNRLLAQAQSALRLTWPGNTPASWPAIVDGATLTALTASFHDAANGIDQQAMAQAWMAEGYPGPTGDADLLATNGITPRLTGSHAWHVSIARDRTEPSDPLYVTFVPWIYPDAALDAADIEAVATVEDAARAATKRTLP